MWKSLRENDRVAPPPLRGARTTPSLDRAHVGRIVLFIQDLLTRHKVLVAEYLEANYDRFFGNYQKLLNSDNYVTRRQSLKVNYRMTFLLE